MMPFGKKHLRWEQLSNSKEDIISPFIDQRPSHRASTETTASLNSNGEDEAGKFADVAQLLALFEVLRLPQC